MQTQVRFASAEDAPKCADWMVSTPLNMFDPAVVFYPSLRTLAVDIDGSPAVYIPFHPVFMIEALAHKPDITPRENAYALRKAQDALESLSRQYGMSEIYWMCGDESLIKFAEKHGYEVLKCAVLRKKVEPQ